MRLEDLSYLSARKIILPGQPEPEWLRRNAEYARILSQPDPALREVAVEPRERWGIVARLRMVLGRA
jgi:hypothetical protein